MTPFRKILSFTGVALVALATLTGATASGPPSLPRDVPMAGADFPGAPPLFELPQGGSVSVETDAAGEVVFTLKRADGVLFAEAHVLHGRTVEGRFYDDGGTLAAVTTAIYAEAGPSASRALAKRGSPTAAKRTLGTCDQTQWTALPWALGGGTFTWIFNSASTPSGLSVDTTETYLRNGHAQWYNNTNWCGLADNSVFGMAYGGRTTQGWGDNGVNTVGFGDMAPIGCSGALACTWTQAPSGVVQESDTRFDRTAPWINGQAANKYDTWSVMAHEVGHTLGFDDVTDTGNTMYHSGIQNSVLHQQLGKGDATGNNSKY